MILWYKNGGGCSLEHVVHTWERHIAVFWEVNSVQSQMSESKSVSNFSWSSSGLCITLSVAQLSSSSSTNLSQVIITRILLSLLLQGVIPLCDQQGPGQDRVRYLWDERLRLRSSPALHFLVTFQRAMA